jgi:hypothetical protein
MGESVAVNGSAHFPRQPEIAGRHQEFADSAGLWRFLRATGRILPEIPRTYTHPMGVAHPTLAFPFLADE